MLCYFYLCILVNIHIFYSVEIDLDEGQDWDMLDVNKGKYISLGFYALTIHLHQFSDHTSLWIEVKQHFVMAGLDLLEGDIENVKVS